MSLFQALCISYFGSGRFPKRRACIVIMGMALSALSCGQLVYHGLPDISPVMHMHKLPLLFSVLIIVQFTVLITHYLSAAAHRSRQTKLAALLFTLPISPVRRWFFLNLPQHIACIISLCITLPSVFSIATMLGLPLSLNVVSVLSGIVSGYGLVYLLQLFGFSLQVLLGITYAAIEYLYLQHTLHAVGGAAVGLGFLIGLTAVGFCCISFLAKRPLKITRNKPLSMTGAALPTSCWYHKKLLRMGRASLCLGFLLSTFVALASYRFHIIDPQFLGMSGALLAASCASDIRGLCRGLKPMEITGLKGAFAFSKYYLLSQFFVCVALSPIIVMLFWQAAFGQVYASLQIIVGISAGSLAGTCIISRAGNVASQCFAVMIAICLVMAPTHLVSTVATNNLMQYWPFIAVVITFVMLSVLIEYIRNPFVWRKNKCS